MEFWQTEAGMRTVKWGIGILAVVITYLCKRSTNPTLNAMAEHRTDMRSYGLAFAVIVGVVGVLWWIGYTLSR